MSTPPPAAKPATPKQYLDTLPADRRKAITAIRRTINANLDPKFKEGIQYNMLGWFVPHSVYPDGYHCDPSQPLPFASVASQKNHIGVYLFCLYQDPAAQARFVKNWKATGNRLDMGKSCIRVRKLEEVPLEVLGEAIASISCDEFIAQYEKQWGANRKRPATKTAKKPAAKKTGKKAAKKAGAKMAGVKKPAAKKATTKTVAKKAAKKKTAKKKTTKTAARKTTAKKAPRR